jgi:uncharacterized membrane protein
MSDENSNLIDEINQIQEEQQSVLEHVEAIKEKANNELLPHLEAIERYNYLIALEIEEIRKMESPGAEIIHISGS